MRLFEAFKESSEVLQESSNFTKFRQYIHGLKPNGKGIAIVTPQHPAGGGASQDAFERMTPAEQQAYLKWNADLYQWGEWYLSSVLRKRFLKQRGVFDRQSERSFVVIDMSVDEAIALGRKWGQTAIIHISNRNDRQIYQMITTGGGDRNVKPKIDSLVSKLYGSNATDYVSIMGSNRYTIPFYDDKEEWEAEYGSNVDPRTRRAGANQGSPIYRNRNTGKFIPPR